MSQGGVTQPGPVGLQTQLGVLQWVAAVLVQQLAALGQTAEVWQGQVAQYQLDELTDGRRGERVKSVQKKRGKTNIKLVRSGGRAQHETEN